MTLTAPTKTDDVIVQLVDRIVAVIEAGEAGMWSKPWTSMLAGVRFPVNAKTEATYQGINMLIGMVEMLDNDYSTHLWATFNQWKALDASVRKGQKGTQMIRWVELFRCEECDHRAASPCDGGHVNVHSMRGRTFYVFNADQVDGYEIVIPDNPPAPHTEVVDMIYESGAVIHEDKPSNQAYYMPSTDIITLPMPAQFDNTQQYYGTLLHELTHWTGHSSRLDRPHGAFGSVVYAQEELVAELGAVFIAAHYQLEVDPHPEHVAYLASWLSQVKEEPKILYEAAKGAQAAFSFLVT